MLEKINFDWDPKESRWHSKYTELRDFFIRKGNTLVLKSENFALVSWCIHQRKFYKKGKLSQEKIDLLEKINFDWDPIESLWSGNYAKLKEYFIREGHSTVKTEEKEYSLLGSWSTKQRALNKKGQLSQEKIDLLEKINFDWDPKENRWHSKYIELRDFFIREGHIEVTKSVNYSLNMWIHSQRALYRKNKLPQDKINLLEKLNFVWDFNEAIWFENYEKLKEFFKKNGHTIVRNAEEFIGKWVGTQRYAFKKGKLPQDKINLLEKLNFVWDFNEAIWFENYEKLKEFFKKNGHSLVGKGEGPADRWCGSQREKYKKRILSSGKIDLLEKLNFVWDPTEYKWQKNYQKLKEFFKENGHSLVKNRDGNLGKWCANQRIMYKEGKLPQEKIDLLEIINFDWEPINNQWMSNYEKLKELFEKNGHSFVKRRDGELGKWSAYQREMYKKGKLTTNKIDLLEKINFQWQIRK